MEIIEIFQLTDLEIISEQLGDLLLGMKVPNMRKLSKKIINRYKDEKRIFEITKVMFVHEVSEVRFLGALVLGLIAHLDKKYLQYLREVYCTDEDWRVKEATAKAFDSYCENVGYENSIGVIRDWMTDSNANVRRAVAEGLRVWTSRPYFKYNPSIAIDILNILKEDNSLYVKNSVANCFSDIGKSYSDLVLNNFSTWDVNNENSRYIIKHGCRHLIKKYPDLVQGIL